ncbi:MAG: hypothetical protein L3K26_20545 [Candidatus Hydrogenedentes bacterium]|nr:hypothetical protein [Candidatus Hydrogenedentota bacterium]
MNNPLTRLHDTARAVLWGAASFVLLLFASAMCSVVAMAAVVSLQPPPANEALLRIPVILTGEGDEDLAGVQFDLNYDTTQYILETVESGAAADDAGKEVILSEASPGQGRILITGFNDNTLFDGHVATLILRPRTPDAAAHSLAVENLLATDPFGNTVPLDYSNDYAYPPLAPEKTEASLAESADESVDEGETDSDVALTETQTAGAELSSEGSTDTQDSVTPGYSGDLSTAASPRTAQENTRQTISPYRVPIVSDNTRASAPTRSRNVATRPSPRGTRTQIASRKPTTNGTRPARPVARNADTSTSAIGKGPSSSPVTKYRRLALAMPTASVIGATETLPNAVALLNDDARLSHLHNDYTLAGIALFLMFFIGFSALHIKVFRWLTGSTWRRRT